MKNTKIIVCLLMGTMILATACGNSYSDNYDAAATSASYYSESESSDGWADADDYTLAKNSATESVEMEAQEPSDLEGYDTSRKIVYTSSIGIESKKFDEDVSSIRELVTSNGGYIESSSQYGSEEYVNRDAYFTARIPADKYDNFMNTVGTVGSMTSKYENVDDITSSYVDVQARLNSLNNKLERLQELEQKAENVEDLLSIEDRINEVQYQIESYTAQKRVYDDQINYSTVDISVTEVATYTEVKADTAWNRFVEAFQGSCSGFIAFLQGLVVAIIYLFPYAIIVIIVLLIIKRIRFKKGKLGIFKFKKKPKKQDDVSKAESLNSDNSVNEPKE